MRFKLYKFSIFLSLIFINAGFNLNYFNNGELTLNKTEYKYDAYETQEFNYKEKLLEKKNSSYANPYTSYVYTHNGSAVEVSINNELWGPNIEFYNELYDNKHPNAKRISTSTNLYNCHSYARYKPLSTNRFWMNNPSLYYNDGSYYEVDKPVIGDIICYFGTRDYGFKKDFNYNYHSGILIGFTGERENGTCADLNMYKVRSKWAYAGLYEHRGDDCPYLNDTQYIKFFRSKINHNFIDHNCECGYYTENHDYHAPYLWFSYTHHFASCGCGTTREEGHVVKKSLIGGSNRFSTCILCGGKAEIGFIQFNSLKKLNTSKNGSYISSNGVIVLADEDIEAYLSGELKL